ncbi:hypothetical protein C8Q76DRAFT_620244, partial [Earliella scabrosa]
MQQPKWKKKQRAVSPWNAFLSLKVPEYNDEADEDGNRDRVSDSVITSLKKIWAEMSPEERTALTADRVKELEARRENRAQGIRNVPLAAFHDTRVTLQTVFEELTNLNTRTETEILFLAVRGKLAAYNKPAIYYSNERVRKCVEGITGCTLLELGLRMEAYCIGGVDKVIENQLQRTLLLKHELSGLLLTLLQKTSKRGQIHKMNYVNFDDAITAKFGIIPDPWPPSVKFQSPSQMTHLEAEICLHAFQSGAAKFRSLSNDEWQTW